MKKKNKKITYQVTDSNNNSTTNNLNKNPEVSFDMLEITYAIHSSTNLRTFIIYMDTFYK